MLNIITKNIKHVFIFSIIVLYATSGNLYAQQNKPVFEGRTTVSSPETKYIQIQTAMLKIKPTSALPATCSNGEIANFSGIIHICNQAVWVPLGDVWTMSLVPTPSIYVADINLTAGIGAKLPESREEARSLPQLKVYNALRSPDLTKGFMSMNISTRNHRWMLGVFNQYAVFNGSLNNSFSIDNVGVLGNGVSVITEDGQLIISDQSKYIPASGLSNLTVKTSTQSALPAAGPFQLNSGGLAATFSLNELSSGVTVDNTMATGIGFGIDPNAPQKIHAAIIGQGNGSIHFGAANPLIGGRIPLALTVGQNKIGVNAPDLSGIKGHLIVNSGNSTKPAIVFRNKNNLGPGLVGKIRFLGPATASIRDINATNNGHLTLTRDADKKNILTLKTGEPADIESYQPFNQTLPARHIMITKPSMRMLRGNIKMPLVAFCAGGAVTIDFQSSSPGFTVKRESCGKYRVTINPNQWFTDRPVAVVMTNRKASYHQVQFDDPQNRSFVVYTCATDVIPKTCFLQDGIPFSFMLVGKR